MALAAPIAFWLAAVSASDYAGASACKSCHPAQFESQSATPHARALAPAKPDQPGDWAFGSGMQAITFVRRLDAEYYLEEAQSWYRAIEGYARTPGHTEASGVRDRIFDPAATVLRCFACHSTGPLQVTKERGIVPHELGIRCEACHGPAAAHARAPSANRPRNPARLSANGINALCGACHRMPAKEQNESSLRDPWNARHQPFMLAASRCFQKSNGKLSCLTCHAPHQTVQREAGAYDFVCAQCHAAPRHQTHIARGSCTGCHMPAVRPQPYLKFANHRIAIYKSDPLRPISALE